MKAFWRRKPHSHVVTVLDPRGEYIGLRVGDTLDIKITAHIEGDYTGTIVRKEPVTVKIVSID